MIIVELVLFQLQLEQGVDAVGFGGEERLRGGLVFDCGDDAQGVLTLSEEKSLMLYFGHPCGLTCGGLGCCQLVAGSAESVVVFALSLFETRLRP